MHYKNGTPALNDDAVITKDYSGRIVAGKIFNLRESESCNADVAVVVPGTVQILTCQTVGQMYSAADAFAALEAAQPVPPVATDAPNAA